MASYELYQVDAFTAVPFAGNPAAVVLLDDWHDDAWLQRVAAENNLSETAFLVVGGGGTWNLRWLTPTVEVDLCGHATVASAHVLWETGRLAPEDVANFDTRSGRVSASPLGAGWIELDFPALPAEACDAPPRLVEALGVAPVWVGRSRFDLLVELPQAVDVEKLEPDLAVLRGIEVRGVCVTAAGDGDVDFVSRFFGPASGVDEDPVTGSAHSTLTPYWSARLGKERLRARQVSARGGDLRLHHRGERVGIAGQAVTVIRGALLV